MHVVWINDSGLFAKGYYADEMVVFDACQIADENGKTVAPQG